MICHSRILIAALSVLLARTGSQASPQTVAEIGSARSVTANLVNPTPVNPNPVNSTPGKPTPADASPTTPTPTKPTPANPTQAKPTPTNATPNPTPAKPTPAPTPADVTPTTLTPTTLTPTKPTPAKPTPAKPTPAKPTPAKPTLAKPTTANLTSTNPTSTKPKPTPAKPTPAKPTPNKPTPADPTPAKPTFTKAFVIDDRLSVLRRLPHLQAGVVRRLRPGHVVYVIGEAKPTTGSKFYRVVVTRRTRGWIHHAAIAIPSRRGEDERILSLIENTDGTNRITLCNLLVQSFAQSRLRPRAMMLLGEEAERVAEFLSQRTRRRLGDVRGAFAAARDYYLSDASLDRYSRLGITFEFNDSTIEFVYDGKAYRDIIKRFPMSDEATIAHQRLAAISRKIDGTH